MTWSTLTENAAGLGSQRLGGLPVVADPGPQALRRINLLIQDVIRNGNERIGKPEREHDFAGYWSRRITDEHRLVYKVTDGEGRIAACRYQYGR